MTDDAVLDALAADVVDALHKSRGAAHSRTEDVLADALLEMGVLVVIDPSEALVHPPDALKAAADIDMRRKVRRWSFERCVRKAVEKRLEPFVGVKLDAGTRMAIKIEVESYLGAMVDFRLDDDVCVTVDDVGRVNIEVRPKRRGPG